MDLLKTYLYFYNSEKNKAQVPAFEQAKLI
jgi:hypothetical protein